MHQKQLFLVFLPGLNKLNLFDKEGLFLFIVLNKLDLLNRRLMFRKQDRSERAQKVGG